MRKRHQVKRSFTLLVIVDVIVASDFRLIFTSVKRNYSYRRLNVFSSNQFSAIATSSCNLHGQNTIATRSNVMISAVPNGSKRLRKLIILFDSDCIISTSNTAKCK